MKFIAAIWGALGVFLLVGKSLQSLFVHAKEAVSNGLSTYQVVFLILYSLFMLYFEGYKGFQKKFSPRTAARVHYLYLNPRPLHVLFAPFFCVGYFYAKRKVRIIAITLSILILCVVFLMSEFCTQPWRGIIDIGVILGLSYGLLSFACFLVKVFTTKDHGISPEIPE
ncbi:MAG: hypothetical protein ABGY95_04610 [Rubritalea sp.]|uniref:hypothetical protein n=1 Tax=Rubritalea sp. TaxID=2109375 RepID=UPI003241F554